MEITDLIVPEVGESVEATRRLAQWVRDELGPETPFHLLKFHPDYHMMEFPETPIATLEKLHAVVKAEGLDYVYLGNVWGHPLEHTYCPGCHAVVVRRYGFTIQSWNLDAENRYRACGHRIPDRRPSLRGVRTDLRSAGPLIRPRRRAGKGRGIACTTRWRTDAATYRAKPSGAPPPRVRTRFVSSTRGSGFETSSARSGSILGSGFESSSEGGSPTVESGSTSCSLARPIVSS